MQYRTLLKQPMLLWRRFEIWRAKRIYDAIPLLKEKADALMRKHAQAPLPLFDRLEEEGR